MWRRAMSRLAQLGPIVLLFMIFVPCASAWTWPVSGPVLQTFSFDPAHPYSAGQHRGIAIGADADMPVLAPASGVVSFAGTVPTNGMTVTIQTGDGLAVSLTHLGSIGGARGAGRRRTGAARRARQRPLRGVVPTAAHGDISGGPRAGSRARPALARQPCHLADAGARRGTQSAWAPDTSRLSSCGVGRRSPSRTSSDRVAPDPCGGPPYAVPAGRPASEPRHGERDHDRAHQAQRP